MSFYDSEAESFEAFIRFYEAEIRLISEGRHNAKRDFTASLRRCLVRRGVVVSGRGRSWVLTPRAEVMLVGLGVKEGAA
ncbi:MAG: hypothetical protein V1924_00865 [Candidatus Bathyarchaeota archaeon]